jgi:hypothetical protein
VCVCRAETSADRGQRTSERIQESERGKGIRENKREYEREEESRRTDGRAKDIRENTRERERKGHTRE